jgi:hypothetical protein
MKAMFRYLMCMVGLALTGVASADDVQTVLGLWGAQGGPWSGTIEIYGPGGTGPQTVGLNTRWEAVPADGSAARTVVKIETFVSSDRQSSSVTLTFADTEPNVIMTPYFVGGKQQNFRFSVVSVSVEDPTHWSTVIASPDDQELYEGRPAVLRYVRTRSGDTVENTKEVNFLDDEGDDTFELRSFIRQTRSAPD